MNGVIVIGKRKLWLVLVVILSYKNDARHVCIV